MNCDCLLLGKMSADLLLTRLMMGLTRLTEQDLPQRQPQTPFEKPQEAIEFDHEHLDCRLPVNVRTDASEAPFDECETGKPILAPLNAMCK